MARVRREASGFTLVELTLSMVFIGILSVAIVLITSNTVSSYRRGILLSQVNSVGMSLVDDMRAAARASSGAPKLVKVDVNIDEEGVLGYGALCLSEASYVWNSGYLLDENSKGSEADLAEDDKPLTLDEKVFALIKIDETKNNSEPKNICDDLSSRSAGKNLSYSDEVASILIDYDESYGNGLALYDLDVPDLGSDDSNVVSAGENEFFLVSFKLGTVNGSANILVNDNACKPPSESGEVDFAYCAINQFSFAVQAKGGRK